MKLGLISFVALASIASVAKASETRAHDYIERLLHVQHESITEAQQELLNRIDNAKASDELCAVEENVVLCTIDSLVKNIGLELESYGVPNTAEEIETSKFDEILSRILSVADPFVFNKYEAYVQNIAAESIRHDAVRTASDGYLFTKIADGMKNVPDMKLSKIVAPFLIKDPQNRSEAISQLIQTMSLDQNAIANEDVFKDVREAIAKKIIETTEKGNDRIDINLTLESLLDLDSDNNDTEESDDKIEESATDSDEEESLADAIAIEAEATGNNVDEEEDEENEENEEKEKE
ncbi:hypothetical protein A0J61_05589 [Choanephora cucurbitarum]|uniref:Uncharacterized protein n=1 Tax=Choanephora cucurbitarum TaxID=101091 RepID=A0A1C7NB53_9FUNG|nr:hypothetical protein A0J61_05589 [Choanephora cucurbitarum]